jgi:hypothetical protein
LVIEPPATVIWTCTGPHRVSATEPVTVFDVAAPLALDEAAALDEPAELELAELELEDGAAVVPAALLLAVVLPLYGVDAELLPPAAAAWDDVDVW